MSVVLHPRNPYVPDRAYERALLRRQRRASPCGGSAAAWTSRRTTRFEEDARAFPRACNATALDAVRPGCYPRFKNGATSISSSSTATSRAASAAFSSTISPSGGFERCFAVMRSVGDAFLAAYLPIVERRRAHRLRRARARLPGLPPRPLRRVQPRLGPRHAVRPAIGRAHRIDPDVAAAAGAVALRLDARTRHRPRPGSTRISSSRATGFDQNRRCNVPVPVHNWQESRSTL